MKPMDEEVLDEIIKIIKDNLELIYKYDDDALLEIKEYCNKKEQYKYKPLSYNKLIYYTELAIAELVNAPNLYDFRSLE